MKIPLRIKIWGRINQGVRGRNQPSDWVKLPYIQNSKATSKIKGAFRNANIGTVFVGGKSLKSALPSIFNKKVLGEERNVVYQLPFMEPSTSLYTGQTKRPLAIRMDEHRGAIRRGETTRSSLAEHCARTGDRPDFNSVKIISRSRFKSHRLINESLSRDINYRKAISKINPIILKPAIRNFSGFYNSISYFS